MTANLPSGGARLVLFSEVVAWPLRRGGGAGYAAHVGGPAHHFPPEADLEYRRLHPRAVLILN